MNRLFQEIRESENRAKARRLQALGRFHVGDVAYPIGIRGDLNMWGIVVDINIPAHKVILNLNGLVRQFEPDELLLTNPEEKEGNREVEDKERVKRVVEETVGKAFAANRTARIARRIATAMANRRVVKGAKAEDYRYDPEHKRNPNGGGWRRTEKGWTRIRKDSPNGLTVKRERRIREMASDSNSQTRGYAAGLPDTPPDVLAKLAKDEDMFVRFDVARNAHTPSETLRGMAGDESDSVRAQVALNIHTPSGELARLADDHHWGVRASAALNLFTPTRALLPLESEDEDEHCRKFATETIAVQDEALSFKKSLGQQNHRGRSLAQLQTDFVANMDRAKYASPEAFERAVRRVKELTPAEFGQFLKAVAADEEEAEA